jgi:hypothetical protein
MSTDQGSRQNTAVKCTRLSSFNLHKVLDQLILLISDTSRKRRPVDETHFCNICTRSAGPGHDKLVFCDNCDTPYHQNCHQPSISDETVASNDKWFCSTCKPSTMAEPLNQRLNGHGMSVGQVALPFVASNDCRNGLHYNSYRRAS